MNEERKRQHIVDCYDKLKTLAVVGKREPCNYAIADKMELWVKHLRMLTGMTTGTSIVICPNTGCEFAKACDHSTQHEQKPVCKNPKMEGINCPQCEEMKP